MESPSGLLFCLEFFAQFPAAQTNLTFSVVNVALTWSHPTIVKFVKSKLGTKRVRKVVKMHSNERVSLKY